jgi:hypothetical protein
VWLQFAPYLYLISSHFIFIEHQTIRYLANMFLLLPSIKLPHSILVSAVRVGEFFSLFSAVERA